MVLCVWKRTGNWFPDQELGNLNWVWLNCSWTPFPCGWHAVMWLFWQHYSWHNCFTKEDSKTVPLSDRMCSGQLKVWIRSLYRTLAVVSAGLLWVLPAHTSRTNWLIPGCRTPQWQVIYPDNFKGIRGGSGHQWDSHLKSSLCTHTLRTNLRPLLYILSDPNSAAAESFCCWGGPSYHGTVSTLHWLSGNNHLKSPLIRTCPTYHSYLTLHVHLSVAIFTINSHLQGQEWNTIWPRLSPVSDSSMHGRGSASLWVSEFSLL